MNNYEQFTEHLSGCIKDYERFTEVLLECIKNFDGYISAGNICHFIRYGLILAQEDGKLAMFASKLTEFFDDKDMDNRSPLARQEHVLPSLRELTSKGKLCLGPQDSFKYRKEGEGLVVEPFYLAYHPCDDEPMTGFSPEEAVDKYLADIASFEKDLCFDVYLLDGDVNLCGWKQTDTTIDHLGFAHGFAYINPTKGEKVGEYGVEWHRDYSIYKY